VPAALSTFHLDDRGFSFFYPFRSAWANNDSFSKQQGPSPPSGSRLSNWIRNLDESLFSATFAPLTVSEQLTNCVCAA
jgi:hypothetical protein